MPELPDVEMQKRYLEATSLHQRIVGVAVRSPDILENVSSRKVGAELEGRSLETSRRHGKYLFAGLDSGVWLMLHFGMDGGLAYLAKEDQEPPYSRMLVRFEDGGRLAYVSVRKLGRVGIVRSVEQFIGEKALGPDALDLDSSAFRNALGRTRAMVKAAFLDQHVVAGIGNICADEILFQARIHPRRPIGDLVGGELTRLFRATKHVLETAIELDADSRRFPESWFISHRYPGARCPRCGAETARTRISNRTTYYCPACQR